MIVFVCGFEIGFILCFDLSRDFFVW